METHAMCIWDRLFLNRTMKFLKYFKTYLLVAHETSVGYKGISYFWGVMWLVWHPTVSRLLSSSNIQSGKYNKMDPILIGTAVSEHVIKEMSKPAVPLVKVLWRTIIWSIFMITSWLIINVALVERRKQASTVSSLTHRIYPKIL